MTHGLTLIIFAIILRLLSYPRTRITIILGPSIDRFHKRKSFLSHIPEMNECE